MGANGARGGTVKTVDTAFDVLDGLRELDGARVSELADHLEMAKSTVHRHLTTLENAEYVAKEGDEYRIGLRFLHMGEYARTQKPTHQMAIPVVEDLAAETDERSLFMVEEHGLAVYLYRGTGTHAVQTNSHVGTRRPLHAIAGGKVILAHFSESRVDEIVAARGMPALTDQTITDRDELAAALERVRERGVAYNREEAIAGLNAVAAPVLGPNEQVLGALSVSGPTHRMKGEWFEETVPDLLLGSANELELNIEYTG